MCMVYMIPSPPLFSTPPPWGFKGPPRVGPRAPNMQEYGICDTVYRGTPPVYPLIKGTAVYTL